MQRKRALRDEMSARRSDRGVSDPDALGARVARRVGEMPEYQRARLVAVYAATEWELPTRVMVDEALRSGRLCALPRVLAGRRLEFAIVARWENLVAGRYGLLEPEDGCKIVELGDADLVLVPGVAFDANGGRLGRGGGYYDRALAAVAGSGALLSTVFGLAHEWQVVPEVPCGEHDVRLAGVVTDRRVLRVARA